MSTNVPAPAAAGTATKAPTNVLAVVAFVLSLVGFNVIAIILGAVGLSQIKKNGERGRGFALAGIWIGAISIVLGIIVVVLVVIGAAMHATSTGALGI